MRLELWPGEPSDDQANWDHVVDIDMDICDLKPQAEENPSLRKYHRPRTGRASPAVDTTTATRKAAG
jgi:hypothetical protein